MSLRCWGLPEEQGGESLAFMERDLFTIVCVNKLTFVPSKLILVSWLETSVLQDYRDRQLLFIRELTFTIDEIFDFVIIHISHLTTNFNVVLSRVFQLRAMMQEYKHPSPNELDMLPRSLARRIEETSPNRPRVSSDTACTSHIQPPRQMRRCA